MIFSLNSRRALALWEITFRIHRGEGAALLRYVEHGVIAEAALALGRSCNNALAGSPGKELSAVGIDRGNDAHEAGGALFHGNALHGLKQQAVAFLIVFAAVPAVAGGIDAGRTVQRIHHEARIVGNGGKARGTHDRLGLENGILLKGRAGLVHVDVYAQLALKPERNAVLLQNGGHFLQLMPVFAG